MEEKKRINRASKTLDLLGDSFRKCVMSVLSIGPVPVHIAFIMDGNRRYAKKHSLLKGDGHKSGYSTLMNMLKYCYELDVKFVTIYAFSIDNFRRRPEEVETTMRLIEEKIHQLINEESMLNRYGVRVYFIGNLKLLSDSVRLAAENVMLATAGNSQVVLSVCLAYTSRDEIVHAVEESCLEKKDDISSNSLSAGGDSTTINVDDIEKHMYASVVAPDPDIIIRSSGETRLSNFLLWQSGNCLLYSPCALWPEIRFRHLVWGVLEYQRNFSCLKHQKRNHYYSQVPNSSHLLLWLASLVLVIIATQLLGFFINMDIYLGIKILFCILVLVKLITTFYYSNR